MSSSCHGKVLNDTSKLMDEPKKNSAIFYSYLSDFSEERASKIRPKRILEALENSDLHIIKIYGPARARLFAVAKLLKPGHWRQPISFAYVEGSTLPGPLANGWKSAPLELFTDILFFAICLSRTISIGFFYRDIHWKFPELYQKKWKRLVRLPFYWIELIYVYTFVDRIFIPSIEMAKYLPSCFRRKIEILPPACLTTNNSNREQRAFSQPVRVIYTGGLRGHYRFSILVRQISKRPQDYSLTIISRSDEIQELRIPSSAQNIRLLAKSGSKTQTLLEAADIGSLFVEPSPYWKFAVPMKLYDYVAAGLPILCSAGTLAAKIVEENELGWVVDYNDIALEEFLIRISARPYEILSFRPALARFAETNRWADRAQTIRSSLVRDTNSDTSKQCSNENSSA